MVRVNKKYLEKELRVKAWRYFLEALKESHSEEALMKNMKIFLTPSEIVMLEKRLAILILLGEGLSYSEIGKLIDVSSVTISFVKHNFIRKPIKHRQYSPIKKLKRVYADTILPHGMPHRRRFQRRLG